MNKVRIKTERRFWMFLLIITLSIGFTAVNGASNASAQQANYPNKPVLFYALGSPGGGFDVTTRAVAATLAKEKMVPVALPVENAVDHVAGTALTVTRYKGDPYMISVHSDSGAMRYATGGSPYNYRDFTPLAGIISSIYGVIVKYDSPYKTLGDLIKDLKEKPEKIVLSGGVSDDRVFYGATFAKVGIDPRRINYIAFNKSSESHMAILEGSAKAGVGSVDEAMALLEGKKLRLLAISPGKRSMNPALKDFPTLKEVGIDFEWANMRYAYAGPGMPDYAVKYWRDTLTKMVKTPTWQEMIKRYQWEDTFMIEGLNEFLANKQAVVTDILTRLGMAKK